MKKQLYILSFISLHIHAMETMALFPDEIMTSIMQYSLPKLNLYYNNTHKPGRWYHTEKGTFPDNSADRDKKDTLNAAQNLQQIFNSIQTSLLLSKFYNNVIVQNISTWLGINKDNVNALLIRATQANIPYFMKLAVAHKADRNFVHKPDGYTPLLCATKHNQYRTCAFLLSKGVSVHIRRENPYAAYVYNPHEWPIHIAIQNGNLELVKLFIQHRATLDFSHFPITSLLTFTAQRNNPYILAVLLEARPYTNFNNHWEADEIEHALETVKRLEVKTDKEKLENRACISILQEALKDSTNSLSEMMNMFFGTTKT